MISVLCQEFGCLPSQIEQEDWTLIKRIMEYRLLEAAKDQQNTDASKLTPGMAAMMIEVTAACED